MINIITLAPVSGLIIAFMASSLSYAGSFNLQQFDINSAQIGDSQHHFFKVMSRHFTAKPGQVKRASSASLLYASPINCAKEASGHSRCSGKFAEMKKPVKGRQKDFLLYRDVVADFNQHNELAFLSTITTTRYKNSESCLQALSKFYLEATSRAEKPSVIYPRNQLDIYYMKIDEKPFTTRMLGKLDSAFSMVWQKQRGDWSAFYSIDFGCRESGHMVVNKTLYDEGKKSAPSSKFQVSRLKSKNM